MDQFGRLWAGAIHAKIMDEKLEKLAQYRTEAALGWALWVKCDHGSRLEAGHILT